MCGRFGFDIPRARAVEYFGLSHAREDYPRSPNIAPGMDAAVIGTREGDRALTVMRWGLVPSWADDPSIGARMINARSETAASKPAFRAAYKRRRCLAPATVFYEWKSRGKGKRKQPMAFAPPGGEPMALAGLWERWTRDDADLATFTILTAEANDAVAPVHDRMPVIVRPEHFDIWLDPGRDPEPVIAAASEARLESWPVDPRMGNPSFQDFDPREAVKER